MALQIAKPTDFGVDATYWNIGAIQEDFKGGGAQLTLYGYKDAAARQDGKQPMSAIQRTFADNDYVAGRSREDWYNILKTKADWQGAEDV